MHQEPRELQRRWEKALAGRQPGDLFRSDKAIVGMDAAAQFLEALIKNAVKKVRMNEQLLPAEVEALELGIRMARPSLRVKEGRLPEHPFLELSPRARASVEASLAGVALIEWDGRGIATGFQVGRRTLVTNKHVVECMDSMRLLERGAFTANFGTDGREARGLRIQRILGRHPLLDLAMLELSDEGPLPDGLRVARAPELRQGRGLLVIGHPAMAPDIPLFVEALFGKEFAVKRVSPGEVLTVEGVQVLHDCTTLRGNSGSPILDAHTACVVAVHAAGALGHYNTGLLTTALHEDDSLREHITRWE